MWKGVCIIIISPLFFFHPPTHSPALLSVVPPLTVANVFSAVQGVRDLERLRCGLHISNESWEVIDKQQMSHDDKLKAVVKAFFSGPHKSMLLWRTVIRALDRAGKTSAADCIMSNAEPLAGMCMDVYMLNGICACVHCYSVLSE